MTSSTRPRAGSTTSGPCHSKADGVVTIGWGGRTRIEGDGLGSGGVAAGFGNLAGVIRGAGVRLGAHRSRADDRRAVCERDRLAGDGARLANAANTGCRPPTAWSWARAFSCRSPTPSSPSCRPGSAASRARFATTAAMSTTPPARRPVGPQPGERRHLHRLRLHRPCGVGDPERRHRRLQPQRLARDLVLPRSSESTGATCACWRRATRPRAATRARRPHPSHPLRAPAPPGWARS